MNNTNTLKIVPDNYVFFDRSGSDIDNTNDFTKFIFLNEDQLFTRQDFAEKFNNSKQCSMIPNKSKGDKFKGKRFNIKNAITCEKEVRNTPGTLYCWRCSTKNIVFYKIGITATTHATDKSSYGLIKNRIIWTKNNFRNAGNGELTIDPLFIINTSLFNCIMIENKIHENSVFNGSIEKEFNPFSGISECCSFLDFEHLEKLKDETNLLNIENRDKFLSMKKLLLEKYEVNTVDELPFAKWIEFDHKKRKMEFNEYRWVKSKFLKDIDREEIKRIISNFRVFESLTYYQDWMRLSELEQ